MATRARFGRVCTLLGACAVVVLAEPPARADNCRVLRYTFQPDCYRPAGAGCVQTITRLDLGPQIAVWIESADGTQFIDTAMVTNMTAARGLGNRPGIWNFLSSPKFPYGKRTMALPIWAHARGTLYDTVVMQDDKEDWLGWHEGHSSVDTYYCRPLRSDEFSVDAITCPTKFNSAKGKLTPDKSYYPPRNDLTTFTNADCDIPGSSMPGCTVSARSYAMMNDLDAIAAATPAYGRPYSGIWYIPADLAAGDYAVLVEVSKEFDNNASHSHASFEDPRLPGYGLGNNFGQPSVVYRVPIHIEGTTPFVAAVSEIVGYSDWTGQDGAIIPRDATISTTDPGSGEARLLEISGPAGSGRVHVDLEQCAPVVCDPPPPAPTPVDGLEVVDTALTATSAEIRFHHAGSNGAPVLRYEIRYRVGSTMTDDEFSQAIQTQTPDPGTPGTPTSMILQDLKPATSYVLGVRSVDACDQHSSLSLIAFSTAVMKFKQVSGCFIATAAYGSDLDRGVAALRAVRDRLRPASSLLAAATDLYYRSGPAAAEVVRRSEIARAVTRRLLGPVTALAEAAAVITTRPSNDGPTTVRDRPR